VGIPENLHEIFPRFVLTARSRETIIAHSLDSESHMRAFALASLVMFLLVPFAFADSRALDTGRGESTIIQGFSSGAQWSQPIAPAGASRERSSDRSQGVFRYDGRGWNYWVGDEQKCWGTRQYPQCS
jgi:hypothetical protein